MKIKNCLALFAGMLPLGSALAAPADGSRPEKPNIIILLTDDLGWQDVKCYDVDEESPMETPNMDSLAKKGVKFWQGYSPCPTCAPTRCAILSGIHGARSQKTHVVGGSPPAPYGKNWRMMSPWYSGRMPVETYSIASALRDAGYATGHCGKWHVAISHHAYPQPKDHGFTWTESNLGVTRKMMPHRLTGFSTKEKGDPYRQDKNGYSTHQNSKDALEFVSTHKEKPFFLFYCTWLVHTPIHTRNERLLDKYCKKLGVEKPVGKPLGWDIPGQKNPFYCAMVEELDYYVGRLTQYLEKTDDPRWPGHKLVENTYVIFTSDNGGMEKVPGEIITDNYPLDRGKISIMEGGTRVPLIITGPDIPQGIESQVMVNGLDFYPTLLSWAGAKGKKGQAMDGLDLSTLLAKDPTNPALLKEANGKTRDTMVWHFPNSAALESSIRIGDFKLLENYDHIGNKKNEQYELYRLYDSSKGLGTRVDIEEAKNLAAAMPEKVKEMATLLHESLTEMKASMPYYNPYFGGKLPHKEKAPIALKASQSANTAKLSYKENGAKVVRADLIYTLNGGHKYEEWFRQQASIDKSGKVVIAELPKDTTHYFINLIDE
ncbi:MAG: sulfatase, partial [Akkermansiaceae bacterium]